ncbi:MAG: response regulator transcription factor [Christensenellaceae bacterium]
MFNVLICEDDKNIRKLIEIRLTQQGYHVFTASDGLEGLKLFESNRIDIIVVDAMMPKMDGFELIREIRKINLNIPAIMVTARGNLEDKTHGFMLGIDDYMVKPIEFDELLLRIKALLRRAKIISEKELKIGDVVLDYATLTVSDGKNRSVTLTKKEFSILFQLLSFPEMSFTKGQLFEAFWDVSSMSDEDSVKVFINRIRSKIKDFPEIDIATIRGVGYRGVRK